jgi:hypothetical protein
MSARTAGLPAVCVVAIVVLLIALVPKPATTTRPTQPTRQRGDALARRRTAEDAIARPAPGTSGTAARSSLARAEADIAPFCPT